MANSDIVSTALDRGYSIDEVANKLAATHGIDPVEVRARGYDSSEILGKLGYQVPPAVPMGGVNIQTSDQPDTAQQSGAESRVLSHDVYATHPDTRGLNFDDKGNPITPGMNTTVDRQIAALSGNTQTVDNDTAIAQRLASNPQAASPTKANAALIPGSNESQDSIAADAAVAVKNASTPPPALPPVDIDTPAVKAQSMMKSAAATIAASGQNPFTMAGVPDDAAGVMNQFTMKAIDSATDGLAQNHIQDFGSSNTEPKTTTQQIAAGLGNLAGFILSPTTIASVGLPASISAFSRMVGDPALVDIAKIVSSQSVGLGLATTAQSMGQAVDNPDDAKQILTSAAESGAGMGAIFGAVSRILPANTLPQFLGRVVGNNVALNMLNGTSPTDNRPLSDKIFDFGLNTLFSIHGAGGMSIGETVGKDMYGNTQQAKWDTGRAAIQALNPDFAQMRQNAQEAIAAAPDVDTAIKVATDAVQAHSAALGTERTVAQILADFQKNKPLQGIDNGTTDNGDVGPGGIQPSVPGGDNNAAGVLPADVRAPNGAGVGEAIDNAGGGATGGEGQPLAGEGTALDTAGVHAAGAGVRAGEETALENLYGGTHKDGTKFGVSYRTQKLADGRFALVRDMVDADGENTQHLGSDGMWHKGEPSKLVMVAGGGVKVNNNADSFPDEESALSAGKDDADSMSAVNHNDWLKSQAEAPTTEQRDSAGRDALYDRAVNAATRSGYASASLVQRNTGMIPIARANRILGQMIDNGVISPEKNSATGFHDVLARDEAPEGASNEGGGEETIYAPQKIGLLPKWVSEDGYKTRTGEVPEIVGTHFSKTKRESLNGSMYGTGLEGPEAARLLFAEDLRLGRRIHFYVDEGNGVHPEAGVGNARHDVKLNNLYDAAKDPLKLREPGFQTEEKSNAFESAVLDHGFDGYYAKGVFGKQGAAVLLGDDTKDVRPELPESGIQKSVSAKLTDRNIAYQTRTRKFKLWSDNLPVKKLGFNDFKDGEGVVVEAIHGTTGDFAKFDMSKPTPENDMGAGIYATNNKKDVSSNYAGEGPDLTNKIEAIASQIADEKGGKYTDKKILSAAKKQLGVKNQGVAMPVFIRFRDPLVLGGKHETKFDYSEPYDETTEEYGDATGSLVRFLDTLRETANGFERGSADHLIDRIYSHAYENEGITAREIFDIEKNDGGKLWDVYDDKGRLSSREVLRKAFERYGYDGIIDTTVNQKFGTERESGVSMAGMDEKTVHFIAFSPDQIKSSIGNNGEFDSANPDITKSKGEHSLSPISKEDALSSMTPGMRKSAEQMMARAEQGKRGGLVFGTEDENLQRAAEMMAKKNGTSADAERAKLDEVMQNSKSVHAQTDTPEFKKWFGDSKVVDADGKPLVVYHGTGNDFSVFEEKSYRAPGERGFFFSADPEIASRYAGFDPEENFHSQEIGNVVPAYLSIKNPLIVDFNGGKEGRSQATKKAIERGHDGMILRNHYDAGGVQDQYVAFDPTQIKSATGNRGTFDPKNPSIIFSKSDTDRDEQVHRLQDKNDYSRDEALQDYFDGKRVDEKGNDFDAPYYSRGQKVNGFYHPDLGTSFINTDNVSKEDVPGVVLHEISHMANNDKLNSEVMHRLNVAEAIQRGWLGPQKSYEADETEQANMLDKAAHDAGYNSVDDLYEKDPDKFTQLAEQFREEHPMMSKSGSAPVWYSQLSKAIDAAPDKMFGKGKMTADWLAANAAKLGVKKAEMDAIGIDDWLKLQPKVSKDDVKNFIAQNGVQVKDVELGDVASKEWDKLSERYDALSQELNDFEGYPVGSKARDRLLQEREIVSHLMDTTPAVGDPKFASYQLPGGENYKELLLTLPEREPRNLNDIAQEMYGKRFSDLGDDDANAVTRAEREQKKAENFRSSHFDQPNILAHVRFNERTDASGAKVLFLEELQSDWGQKGKKQGFGSDTSELVKTQDAYTKSLVEKYGTEAWRTHADTLEKAYWDELSQKIRAGEGGVPSAPFVTDTKAWTALALKRMIRYAAENGFDKIAWTTGEQQADRYDLSKQIDELIVFKNDDGTFNLQATMPGGGNRDIGRNILSDKLEDYVGKDLAKTIAGQETKSDVYNADQLRVGGEGMKGYYDQIVPQVANDVLKKLGGGKVEDVGIPDPDVSKFSVVLPSGKVIKETDALSNAEGLADKYEGAVVRRNEPNTKQQGFTITPELRAKVINEGMPLFSKNAEAQGGDIYARVRARMAASGVTGDAREATSYLVEEAMSMGQTAGHSRIDTGFWAWATKALPPSVVNTLRQWVANVRAAMFRHGLVLKEKDLTIDDFVAVARANMKDLASGKMEAAGGNMAIAGSEQPHIIAERQAAITELHAAKDRMDKLERMDVPEFDGTTPALHDARQQYNDVVKAAESLGVNVRDELANPQQSVAPKEGANEPKKSGPKFVKREDALNEKPPAPLEKVGSMVDSIKKGLGELKDAYLAEPEFTESKRIIGKYTGALQEIDHNLTTIAKEINLRIPKDRQIAITNYMQAGGDEAVLRQRAADSFPEHRKGYEDALTLTPDEKATAKFIQDQQDEFWKKANDAGILEGYVENYVRGQWEKENPAGQRVMAIVGSGMLNAKPREAMQKVFQNYFEGEQAGYVPTDKRIGFQFVAAQRSIRGAIAARQALTDMMHSIEKDGRPMVAVGGGGSAIDEDSTSVTAERTKLESAKSALKKDPTNKTLIRAVDKQRDVLDKAVQFNETDFASKPYFVKPNIKPEDTADYKPIDHPAMRKWKWIGTDASGSPIMMQGQMYVHPEAYGRLNALLGKSLVRSFEIPKNIPVVGGTHPGAAMLKAGAFVKGTILIGPFHQFNLGEHAVFHGVDPTNPLEIDFDKRPVLREGVEHGLMLFNHNAMFEFSEGLASGGLLHKLPLAGTVLKQYQEWLFQDYIPRLKAEMFENAVTRAEKYYAKDLASGKFTRDQLLDNAAKQGNAAFGELNYKYMGRNPTYQDALRLVLLAPDFLEARFKFAGQALRPRGKEQAMAFIRGAIIMGLGAQTINAMFGDNREKIDQQNPWSMRAITNRMHWDKPFSVIINGHEYSPRSVPADMYHLIEDPRGFWYNRVNPLWGKPVIELASGKDINGQKESFVDGVKNILKSFTPIPVQGAIRNNQGQTVLQGVTSTLLQSIGISNFPSKTEAEKEIGNISFGHRTLAGESERQQKRYSDYADLKNDYMMGRLNSMDDVKSKAKESGLILTRNMMKAIIASRDTSPEGRVTLMEHRMSRFTSDELVQVWQKMSDEERGDYKNFVLSKLRSAHDLVGPEKLAAIRYVQGSAQ